MSEQLYSVHKAAKLLDVHPRTVANMVKSGDLVAVKLGPRMTRIADSEIERYLRKKREDAVASNV